VLKNNSWRYNKHN